MNNSELENNTNVNQDLPTESNSFDEEKAPEGENCLSFIGAEVELDIWDEIEEVTQQEIRKGKDISPAPQRESFIITGEDLLNMKVTEMEYLVEPIFPRTGIIALAGSSDTGKSSLLRQLATDIACGTDTFIGFNLNTKHKNVIYSSTEDDSSAMAFLLNKQNPDTKPETLRNLRYIFDNGNLLKKLEEALKQAPADCFIIDTFTDLYGEDMNATNKVRNFINGFSSLANKYGCLGIFLHHTGKRTEHQAPSKNNLIGSQGFEAKMRLVMELRKDNSDPDVRHLCIVKGNYIPSKDKESSYVLGFDETMKFTNLNRRVPMAQLVMPKESSPLAAPQFKEQVLKLYAEHKSVRKVAECLKKQGQPIGKTKISEMVKNCPVVQTSLKESTDGQDDEYELVA